MVNTTETYWAASGESLHTYAHSIESIGGGLNAGTFRGEDVTIPYRPGDVWQAKTPASRIISLGMWVRGVAWDAGSGAVAATPALFQANWNRLVRLIRTPGRQFVLTKRMYDYNESGVPTLYTSEALAEYNGGLEPTMKGRTAGRCVTDLKLADPYFYDTQFRSSTLVNGDQTIWVRGNSPTRNVRVVVNGARTNPQVRVKTGIDHLVKYTGVIGSGSVATLDMYNQTASTAPSGGTTFDSELLVTHSGNPFWLELQPGPNIVNLSSSSGAGVVTLQVKGAWV